MSQLTASERERLAKARKLRNHTVSERVVEEMKKEAKLQRVSKRIDQAIILMAVVIALSIVGYFLREVRLEGWF